MLREVEYNETVSRCVRPLHRVCPGDRVRREVDTMDREERSDGPSCKYYNETVCIKKESDITHDDSEYKEDCQLLEVKCA